LNNLGTCSGGVGRWDEAVASAEEAVKLYRRLAADDPAVVANLAMALNNLGVRYGEVGRRDRAVAPTEEAVKLYRRLAADNPAFVADLASALNNLGNRYSEVYRDAADRIENRWRQVLDELPHARSMLITLRCATAEAGTPGVVNWLVDALNSVEEEMGLLWVLHEQGRRHRAVDADGFDAAWHEATGQTPPGWLTIDAELLKAAADWIDALPFEDERDHLASHPHLLEDAADDAIAEALLKLRADARDRYVELRRVAQDVGVEAAYRPLVLGLLARRFAAADWDEQRQLLTDRRADLLTAEAAAALDSDEPNPELRIATALLKLARLDADGPLFEAVGEPARFPDLLHRCAVTGDPQRLLPTTTVAIEAATDHAGSGLAVLYAAVAMLLADPEQLDTAAELVKHARRIHPDGQTDWLARVGEIAAVHAQVAGLFGPLTRQLPDDDQQGGSDVDS
jgi:tetratricopeptide (TPR) repeat protein